MATLINRLIDLNDQIGEDMYRHITKTGRLSNLETVHKTTIVGAINECINKTEIDDLANGITTTWSAAKIQESITNNAAALRAEVFGGVAPETLDTIREIALAFANEEAIVQTILNTLNTKVSFTEVQSLTSEQKAIARTNIGATSQDEFSAFQTTTNSVIQAVNQSITQIDARVSAVETGLTNTNVSVAAAFQAATAAKAAADAAKAAADASVVYTDTVASAEAAARIAGDQALDVSITQKVAAVKTEILTEYIGQDIDLLARYLGIRGPFLD